MFFPAIDEQTRLEECHSKQHNLSDHQLSRFRILSTSTSESRVLSPADSKTHSTSQSLQPTIFITTLPHNPPPPNLTFGYSLPHIRLQISTILYRASTRATPVPLLNFSPCLRRPHLTITYSDLPHTNQLPNLSPSSFLPAALAYISATEGTSSHPAYFLCNILFGLNSSLPSTPRQSQSQDLLAVVIDRLH